jgi:hypothetical protein
VRFGTIQLVLFKSAGSDTVTDDRRVRRTHKIAAQCSCVALGKIRS